jgi:hypothetical protein
VHLCPLYACGHRSLDAVAEDDTFHAAFVATGTELITSLFQFDTTTGCSREWEEALIRS